MFLSNSIKNLLGVLGFLPCFCGAVNVDFKLDAVQLPKAVSMIYGDVLEKPYMLDPQLANDERLISFNVTEKQDFEQFIVRYFGNMNIKTYEKNGVVYIAKIEPKVVRQSFVYSPVYRDVEYLAEFLKHNNNDEKAVSASGDKLVYYGTGEEIARVKSVLKGVDVPGREIVVTGYVFEVQTEEKEGSGINLLAKLLSGKLGINIGVKQNYENFITVNTGNLDAMIELFRTDSRFHVVSSPTIRVKSGSKGNFSVGSDVPILGSVTYDRNGRPVQSIEYRSSGVIFDILPTIKADNIDIKIQQQLSNFVKTDTGVNQSPTLIKRDIVTDVSVKNGDVIVLGGLAENKITEGETGFSFLPKGFLTGKSKNDTKTDIVILLQVKLV
ncbi:type II secretion system protein GspD [Aggregatibacter actinomycetemcomitans]|uniref:type II secretion system protein GspD n=2 Tax=Aggregatibacter actinomycetemcomitans TaxID=714 RepID=UPI00201CB19A|nr:type II secretion system protein GspD [Aggregatibacter actinomycetemcomitans]